MTKLRGRKKARPVLIDDRILASSSWKKGYAAFQTLLRKPLGWIYIPREAGERLLRTDPPKNCDWYARSGSCARTCESYLAGVFRDKSRAVPDTVRSFQCHAGRHCAFFPLKVPHEKQAFFITCNLREPVGRFPDLARAFHEFLKMELALAHKDAELDNFYETVHPRALALSTMHSVHRVVSSAFNLNELLPRIGRLSMQILKVRHCSIFMIDEDAKQLCCKFSTETRGQQLPPRRRMGRGLAGKVAETGEIHFGLRVLAVPFVDQEVLGVVTIKGKIDGKSFTHTDLEILKILAEQTVVAIKNAKLYDETQQLTLGSIRSINELLELDFAGDNVHLPLFARLVREIGMDLGLTRWDLVNLERAVLLLDTGYVGIPDHILSKKTELTREEFEAIKEHPHRGAQVLQQISSLRPIIPIILHHHERWDGKGYPKGLRGEAIPVGARIMAVVDSFTAMISKRPYRETRKIEEAVEEIKRNSGTQFDPKVVLSFLKVLKRVGTV